MTLEKRFVSLYWAGVFALLVSSAFYMVHNGCFYIEESGPLLNHYLSAKPLLWKVFYAPGTEGPGYVFRAREFSYLFNLWDAQFIRFSFQVGIPHFLSGTYFICLLLAAGIHVRFSRRHFGTDPVLFAAALGIFLVFLASPTIFFSTQYFRTGKMLAGFFLFWQAWLVLSLYLRQAQSDTYSPSLGFAVIYSLVSLFAGLSDEQGLFLTFTLTGGMFLLILQGRIKNANRLLLGAAISGAVLLGYRFFIGQLLAANFAGLSAHRFDPEFQSLRIVQYLSVAKNAFLLLLSYFSNMVWRLPKAIVALLLIGLLKSLSGGGVGPESHVTGSLSGRVWRSAVPFFLYSGFMLWLLLFLMTLSDSQDARFGFIAPHAAVAFLKMWYYPIPIVSLTAVSFVALLWLFSRSVASGRRPILLIAVLILFSGNLVAIYSGRKTMRSHGIARPGVAAYIVTAALGKDPVKVTDGDTLYSAYMRELILTLRGFVSSR